MTFSPLVKLAASDVRRSSVKSSHHLRLLRSELESLLKSQEADQLLLRVVRGLTEMSGLKTN